MKNSDVAERSAMNLTLRAERGKPKFGLAHVEGRDGAQGVIEVVVNSPVVYL